MQLNVDPDVKAVLQFMQENITASKLVSVADKLPAVAGLLWGHYPQEPLLALALEKPKIVECNQSQPIAI